MSLLIIVLITSGFVIWDEYFSQYTTITQKRIAVLIHALAAVTIICVWIVHVYAAIWIRGTIGAMTRGQRDRRLGVAPSSQMAARTGRGQAKSPLIALRCRSSLTEFRKLHVARRVREVI